MFSKTSLLVHSHFAASNSVSVVKEASATVKPHFINYSSVLENDVCQHTCLPTSLAKTLAPIHPSDETKPKS